MDKMQVAAAYEGLSLLIKGELAQAIDDAKASVQEEVDIVKMKLYAMHAQAKAKVGQAKSEVDAKIDAMCAQMKQARDLQKSKIEKHICEVKSRYAVCNAEFRQAEKPVNSA